MCSAFTWKFFLNFQTASQNQTLTKISPDTHMMNWQQLISSKRLGKENKPARLEERRTEFQRDFDRLIFSAPFRRLQNKTQVFPLPGSVFVHNRLTHSLEVSSVGRSLGTDVSRELIARHPELEHTEMTSMGAIVSAACLAHDMGNPPFGHSGEKAIRTYFSEGKGRRLRELVTPDGKELSEAEWMDMTRFDGNANTFRLLTHQFNARRRGGFVMTYATLASIVKYPYGSDRALRKPKFGYFEAERLTYLHIAESLGIACLDESPDGSMRHARHPLVYLVEAADDICYEVMDIEDAHKLRILSDEQTMDLFLAFFDEEERRRLRNLYQADTDIDDQIVYYRSCVINALERACVRVFVDNEEAILEGTFRGSLIDHLPSLLRDAYRHCVDVAQNHIYRCKEVTNVDLAGYHIIYTLLELMTDAVMEPEKAYSGLLLAQVPSQYEVRDPRIGTRLMAVLDYLSGMTDVYALDLYRKINGHSLPSV